jgi:hypothetical protein
VGAKRRGEAAEATGAGAPNAAAHTTLTGPLLRAVPGWFEEIYAVPAVVLCRIDALLHKPRASAVAHLSYKGLMQDSLLAPHAPAGAHRGHGSSAHAPIKGSKAGVAAQALEAARTGHHRLSRPLAPQSAGGPAKGPSGTALLRCNSVSMVESDLSSPSPSARVGGRLGGRLGAAVEGVDDAEAKWASDVEEAAARSTRRFPRRTEERKSFDSADWDGDGGGRAEDAGERGCGALLEEEEFAFLDDVELDDAEFDPAREFTALDEAAAAEAEGEGKEADDDGDAEAAAADEEEDEDDAGRNGARARSGSVVGSVFEAGGRTLEAALASLRNVINAPAPDSFLGPWGAVQAPASLAPAIAGARPSAATHSAAVRADSLFFPSSQYIKRHHVHSLLGGSGAGGSDNKQSSQQRSGTPPRSAAKGERDDLGLQGSSVVLSTKAAPLSSPARASSGHWDSARFDRSPSPSPGGRRSRSPALSPSKVPTPGKAVASTALSPAAATASASARSPQAGAAQAGPEGAHSRPGAHPDVPLLVALRAFYLPCVEVQVNVRKLVKVAGTGGADTAVVGGGKKQKGKKDSDVAEKKQDTDGGKEADSDSDSSSEPDSKAQYTVKIEQRMKLRRLTQTELFDSCWPSDLFERFYSDRRLLQRESLRFAPAIVAEIRKMWRVWTVHVARRMNKEGYLLFFGHVQMNLSLGSQWKTVEGIARVSADTAGFLRQPGNTNRKRQALETDWRTDSEGKTSIGYPEFALAYFQAVDMWTDSISEERYMLLFRLLWEKLTRRVVRQRRVAALDTGVGGNRKSQKSSATTLQAQEDRVFSFTYQHLTERKKTRSGATAMFPGGAPPNAAAAAKGTAPAAASGAVRPKSITAASTTAQASVAATKSPVSPAAPAATSASPAQARTVQTARPRARDAVPDSEPVARTRSRSPVPVLDTAKLKALAAQARSPAASGRPMIAAVGAKATGASPQGDSVQKQSPRNDTGNAAVKARWKFAVGVVKAVRQFAMTSSRRSDEFTRRLLASGVDFEQATLKFPANVRQALGYTRPKTTPSAPLVSAPSYRKSNALRVAGGLMQQVNPEAATKGGLGIGISGIGIGGRGSLTAR